MKPSASTNESTPFDFLRSYIETLLDQTGFAEVSESTRAQYVPQFVAEAERRLGLVLMPKLNETSAKELVQLAQAKDTTPEALQAFWQKNVTDFSEVVQKTLADFSAEMKTILASIRK